MKDETLEAAYLAGFNAKQAIALGIVKGINDVKLTEQPAPVEPAAWMDALKDAFFDGFTSVETYNDTRLNSPEEAWANYEPPTPPAAQRQPLTDKEELSNGLAIALHDAMLIRIGRDDEATRQAISRIDKLVAKYTNEAAHGIKENT
jgi:hypothetical protein